jgi:hypothetical protein
MCEFVTLHGAPTGMRKAHDIGKTISVIISSMMKLSEYHEVPSAEEISGCFGLESLRQVSDTRGLGLVPASYCAMMVSSLTRMIVALLYACARPGA